MEISVPEGLKVVIGTVAEVCERLRSHALDRERAILLFSGPRDVVRFMQSGGACAVVNIGGMRFVPGKRKVLDVLAVDDADVEAFREILRQGTRVEVQTVPTEKPQLLETVLKAGLDKASTK
jgi:PTS system mannose-specific IIB component